jgi:hypothetical protein
MKQKIFTLFATLFLLSCWAAHAQLLMTENFDYPSGIALVQNPISNSDNYSGLTGWSTQSSSVSAIDCYDIASAPLTYNGYVSSGIGNALKYSGLSGQGVFKLFPINVRNDSAVYISFLLYVPNDEMITGGDYFFGLKMEASASSTNWGGRLFAMVDPSHTGQEVMFGINKGSGGTTTWVNFGTGPFYPANQTLLIVYKYKVGVLNGKNATDETGKYDDQMSVYVNPSLTGGEPATPTLYNADPTQKDIYRYTSTGSVLGGARGIYLRSSAEGNAPAFIMDGIRVGLTWNDVMPAPTGIKTTTADNFRYKVDDSKHILVFVPQSLYTSYRLVSVSGQQVLAGQLNSETSIDASSVRPGAYILNLSGSASASAKVILR